MSNVFFSWIQEARWFDSFVSSCNCKSKPQNAHLTQTVVILFAVLVGVITVSGCGGIVPNTSSSSASGNTPTPTSTGDIVASPTSVDFGTIDVGNSSNQQVVVTNQGTQAVQISQLTLSDSSFSVDGQGNQLPLSLAAGSTLNLKVHFNPKSGADTSGQLTISTNSAFTPTANVKLHGRGKTQPVSNGGALSSLSCASASMTGAGTDVCTVTLTGGAPSGGLSVSLSSNNSAVTVPGTVTVSNNASTANFTAIISAVSTAQTTTLTASSGGVSTTFSLQLNPDSAPAPAAAALSAVSCSNTTITGPGTDACTVTLTGAAPSGGFNVNLSSNDGVVTVPASVSVLANASSATFTATVGSFTSAQTATLTGSAGGVSKSVALQLSAATPTLTVSATSLSFGSVVINTPATQSVVLKSTGTVAVTVNSASVTGTGFSVSGGTFPATLNPGQSVTLTVQFDPTTAGAASGQLTIQSNSTGNASANVSLSGTGAPHEVALAWNAPGSSSAPIAGYNIYRASSGTSSFQLINSSADTQTSYTDNTVQSGQKYDYVVKSVDSAGSESAPSNTTTVAVP